MTFTEWYEKSKKDRWHEDYALLYSFADETLEEYEEYCRIENIKPIWNG